MENDYYKQYEPFFGSWYIKRFIGAGSYGKVFEIAKKDALDMVYTGALKAISVPASAEELDEVLLTNNMDPESAATVFRDYVEALNREISLMSKLKGHSNIVSYEDHELIPQKDGPGWDIFIRMELLTSLTGYQKQNKGISRRDVVRLGIDLCSALEVCQKYNIIHRDIKPANIFISDTGDFKLGDFGVARTASAATGASTRAGTPNYMAPEVFRGEKYTSNVDIYSLGLVMYQLLNDNRMPFYPPRPQVVTTEKREQALAQRLSGMALPPPAHADGRLAEIILKACSPRPADRYESPAVMKQALEAILYTKEEGRLIYPDGDTVPVPDTSSSQKPPDRSTANNRSVTQKIFPPDTTPTDDTATERVTPPEEERRRQEETARAAEEERRRKEQEAKEAEKRRVEEERRGKEAAEKEAAEAARRRAEAERKAREEAVVRKAEEERRRKEREEKKAAEEAAQRRAKEKRLKKEAERKEEKKHRKPQPPQKKKSPVPFVLGGAAAVVVLGGGLLIGTSGHSSSTSRPAAVSSAASSSSVSSAASSEPDASTVIDDTGDTSPSSVPDSTSSSVSPSSSSSSGSSSAAPSSSSETTVTTYTASYSVSGGGTLTSGKTSGKTRLNLTVAEGKSVSVTAVPSSGYHFVRWSDGSTSATRTDQNIQKDLNVTAVFEADPTPVVAQYSVRYSVQGEGGSIQDANGTAHSSLSYTVTASDSVTVTAVPSSGYHFVKWSDGSTSAARTDRSFSSDLSLSATFEKDAAPAPSPAPSSDIKWDYGSYGSGIVIYGYSGSSSVSHLTIPSTIDGKPVVRIEKYAFNKRSELQSVTIPSSVIEIGTEAFTGTRISSVTVSSSCSVSQYAFPTDCTVSRQ